MSARNVAVVQDALRHINETGEPPWRLYSTDVTFVTRGGETVSGHEGFEEGLAIYREMRRRGLTLELREVIDGGDVVIVVVRAHVPASGGSGALDIQEAWASWFRDELIVRVEQYDTRDAAMRAAGLED